jgi:hypothetical protein
MQAINSQIEEIISRGEGRYLSATELQPIKQYVQTFTARAKTYQILQEKSEVLVRHALKKFMVQHPDIMQKHGKRCHYDMTMLLRYVGIAILRNDPRFLNDALVLWQANILTAYQKQKACHVAYRYLQEAVKEHLPSQAEQMIDPYIEMMMQALDLPPKLMAGVQ